MNISDNEYAQWLYSVPGLGSKGIFGLYEKGLSPRNLYEMSEKEVSALLTKKKTDALIKHRWDWNFELESERLKENSIRFISFDDADYPDKLRMIPDPPYGIYVKGRLPDEHKPSVAIIGARMCSDYGRFMAREFGRGLGLYGVQIISGMARGVDGISQKAAIEAGGSSYGILGCGVNICYPEENRDVFNAITRQGGLISEYYPDMLPKSNLFPMRNRIISALSDIVLVVEARQKSGTQLTVDQALEQGIPGRVTDRLSDGCNYLISQGAGIATSVQDVLDRLNMMYQDKKIGINSKAAGKERASVGSNTGVSENDRACTVDMDDMQALNTTRTLEEEILDTIDIIPISASNIMEKLFQRGISISIPELMSKLIDLTYNGSVAQEGVYYRRRMENIRA